MELYFCMGNVFHSEPDGHWVGVTHNSESILGRVAKSDQIRYLHTSHFRARTRFTHTKPKAAFPGPYLHTPKTSTPRYHTPQKTAFPVEVNLNPGQRFKISPLPRPQECCFAVLGGVWYHGVEVLAKSDTYIPSGHAACKHNTKCQPSTALFRRRARRTSRIYL